MSTLMNRARISKMTKIAPTQLQKLRDMGKTDDDICSLIPNLREESEVISKFDSVISELTETSSKPLFELLEEPSEEPSEALPDEGDNVFDMSRIVFSKISGGTTHTSSIENAVDSFVSVESENEEEECVVVTHGSPSEGPTVSPIESHSDGETDFKLDVVPAVKPKEPKEEKKPKEQKKAKKVKESKKESKKEDSSDDDGSVKKSSKDPELQKFRDSLITLFEKSSSLSEHMHAIKKVINSSKYESDFKSIMCETPKGDTSKSESPKSEKSKSDTSKSASETVKSSKTKSESPKSVSSKSVSSSHTFSKEVLTAASIKIKDLMERENGEKVRRPKYDSPKVREWVIKNVSDYLDEPDAQLIEAISDI